jgi:hypothetical protein
MMVGIWSGKGVTVDGAMPEGVGDHEAVSLTEAEETFDRLVAWAWITERAEHSFEVGTRCASVEVTKDDVMSCVRVGMLEISESREL